MGFNIAGVVIDRNFNKEIDELGNALRWGIEVIEEINFEQASSNWTPEGEFNIYFTEKATLIYFPHEWAINKYHVVGSNSLCYAYSATAMTFIVSYLDKESNHRFFMESEGERMAEEGQPLELEKEFQTADGLIFKLLDVLTDDNYHAIDFADKAFRCRKVQFVQKSIDQNIDKKSSSAQGNGLETTAPKERSTSANAKSQVSSQPQEQIKQPVVKKWWEFWK